MSKLFSKRFFLSSLLCFSTMFLWAQASRPGQSVDDLMRSHNKIYVVMAVCLVILIVLFIYLVRIDLKISKKEKDFK
ncbi:CcmD family protein [Hanamia caeni]